MTPQPDLTPAERIDAFAAAYGLTMAAEFVPYSVAKMRPGWDTSDGTPWRGLTWKVQILRDGREILATDYSAGTAHCPGYRASGAALAVSGIFPEKRARAALIDWEIENGKAGRYSHGWSGPVSAKPPRPILPELRDVLHSLAIEASVLDAGGFEDWAADFGYDTDSRKAEATYRACLEIALKLRASLGDDGLTALRDACTDY